MGKAEEDNARVMATCMALQILSSPKKQLLDQLAEFEEKHNVKIQEKSRKILDELTSS